MKYLRIMILAAASCLAATAATAQENVKAAIEKLVTGKDVAVNHTVSVKQMDEADPSKLIDLCEVYNFQLTEKQKPLLDELEEAFVKDKQNVKTIIGKFSRRGEQTNEYAGNGADKLFHGKGQGNFVFLTCPSFSRTKYYVLANSDRVENGDDYHYTYALRWSDMNWEGKDEFPYRYMGKIVITYGTAFPNEVLIEVVSKGAALKAAKERRAKLMPALISQKISELQKKDTISKEEAIELYQYFKTFRDASEEPVDPDDLGICMNEMQQLFNRKQKVDDAIPYLMGAANILPKLKSESERKIASNKGGREQFAANFAKYLKESQTKGAEACGSLLDLVKKAVDNDWISQDEREAFALEIENFLSRSDAKAEGSALLKGAVKKLRGE